MFPGLSICSATLWPNAADCMTSNTEATTATHEHPSQPNTISSIKVEIKMKLSSLSPNTPAPHVGQQYLGWK